MRMTHSIRNITRGLTKLTEHIQTIQPRHIPTSLVIHHKHAQARNLDESDKAQFYRFAFCLCFRQDNLLGGFFRLDRRRQIRVIVGSEKGLTSASSKPKLNRSTKSLIVLGAFSISAASVLNLSALTVHQSK